MRERNVAYMGARGRSFPRNIRFLDFYLYVCVCVLYILGGGGETWNGCWLFGHGTLAVHTASTDKFGKSSKGGGGGMGTLVFLGGYDV